MINITRKKPVTNFIGDIESMFDLHLNSKDFDSDDLDIIQKVDKALLIDRSTGLVQTPFGLTSLRNLSTGCKTVLVYNYCRKNNIDKIINITESGANALDVLFDLMCKYNDSCTILYLGHYNLLDSIKDHEYNVDGKVGTVLCLL